ncbi:hypothetical protein [Niallia circulans]|uniref:hypothetical protein n=1 Tax=Niallia circulans TaxID=1397 RepID=UPI00300988CD
MNCRYISQPAGYISQSGGEISQPAGYISQSGEEISQPAEISAKVEGESAKLQKYQPKWRGNQPNSRNISQSGGGISQTPEISAKVERKSANLQDISQSGEEISQPAGYISQTK